ncbi:MAG: SCO family protein [Acidobacteriota bacterium]
MLIPALLLSACSGGTPANAREYPLQGEVLAIKGDRTEITIKHGDIKGFMPAMTMPFPIKRAGLLDGLAVGDLVTATLVVTDQESFLSTLEKTGSLPPDRRSTGQPMLSDSLRPGAIIPDIGLTDQTGHKFTLAAYRGQYVVFTFVYTRCPLPDYCPRMSTHFAAIQRAFADRPSLRMGTRLLSISFDPDFDTSDILAAYAKRVGADDAVWRFATAPRAPLDAFGLALGLTVMREGMAGDDITHNLRTVLMDREGKLVKIYNGNDWSPDDVVRDLEALIK